MNCSDYSAAGVVVQAVEVSQSSDAVGLQLSELCCDPSRLLVQQHFENDSQVLRSSSRPQQQEGKSGLERRLRSAEVAAADGIVVAGCWKRRLHTVFEIEGWHIQVAFEGKHFVPHQKRYYTLQADLVALRTLAESPGPLVLLAP